MIHPVRAEDTDAEATRLAATAGVGGIRRQIDELYAAVALLTRLPRPSTPVVRTGARGFAIVGGLMGLATLVPLVALGAAIPTVAALLAVATLAILSGGLHLDGLADTFDALVAVGPDAAERARKDPAVGASGATALILVLGIDVAALADLVTHQGVLVAGVACVVAGSVSRAVPAVLARLGRSDAVDDGVGAWFVRRTSTGDAVVVATTCLIVALVGTIAIGRVELLTAGVIAGVGAVGLGLLLVRLRRQLDGDLLGASVEIAFAATVLVAALIAGWPRA